MTIDEIIAHVMTNPENTNPAILREQLNSIASNGNSSSAAESESSLGNAFIYQPNANDATYDEETQTVRLKEEISNTIAAAHEEDLIIGLVSGDYIYRYDYIDANSENSPITDGFMLLNCANGQYILSYDAVIPDQEALITYLSNLTDSNMSVS